MQWFQAYIYEHAEREAKVERALFNFREFLNPSCICGWNDASAGVNREGNLAFLSTQRPDFMEGTSVEKSYGDYVQHL